MRLKGYKGNTMEIRDSVNPKPFGVGQRGSLSVYDRMKLQKAYGSHGCGDSQAGEEGGSLSFNKSLHLNLNTCLWWLATNSRKQITLNISVLWRNVENIELRKAQLNCVQEIEFSGDCETNYLEVRLGGMRGDVLEKYCKRSKPLKILETKSNGVFVKWVKEEDDKKSSFSGKWMASELNCCKKGWSHWFSCIQIALFFCPSDPAGWSAVW